METTSRGKIAPVVLITGALTGIGRAVAEIFAREGAHVVVSGRHASRIFTVLPDHKRAVAEMFRVLQPGGIPVDGGMLAD
jgi:NAD(P)-dependent dehydrogenase (short-subunit alcohol dehydrogenase family)